MNKQNSQRSARRDKNGNGTEKADGESSTFHFGSVESVDIPHGRKGKHRAMVAHILEDLDNREDDQAVRVPLSSLKGEKLQNLRSAINRVSRAKKLPIATCSDEKYLYVWNINASESGSDPQDNQV